MQPTATFGRRGRPTNAPTSGGIAAGRKADVSRPSMPSMADLLRGAAEDDDAAPSGVASPRVSLSSGSGVAEIDMMRFIGGNWPKYRNVWHAMRGSSAFAPSFSFAGLFFGGLWLLYRKQWGWFFAVLLVQLGIMYVDPKLGNYSSLAIQIALGIFGKALVVKSGMSRIEGVKGLGLSSEETNRRIEKSGGVSWAAPAVFFVAIMVIAIIAGVALGVRKGARADLAPAAAVTATA